MNDPTYWLGVIERVHSAITFGDQKVVSVLSLNTAVIGGLLLVIRQPLCPARWGKTLGWSACLCLAVSVAIGGWVIYPAGIYSNAERGPGLVDQYRVTQYPTAAEFVAATEGADQAEHVRHLKQLAYDYSRIHDRKYYWIRRMILVSGVGWLLAAGACVALSVRRPAPPLEHPA